MRSTLIGLALATASCAILGLSGCGSSSTSTATAATPTAVVTAAPTPTANLTATASTAYLAAATSANAANNAQFKALCKSTRIADIKSCWAKDFTIEEQFLTAITAITFPDSMKADVSALISTSTKAAQLANTLSQQDNPNADTLDYNAYNAADNDATAAAGVVRHDLGLPPVPAV